jgi:DNA polymerase epsilon subunit 1
MGSPALAFVRTVCELMGLDQRCQEQVEIMKKCLLRSLHVAEFSAAAQFKEPCESFVVPDVHCRCVVASLRVTCSCC